MAATNEKRPMVAWIFLGVSVVLFAIGSYIGLAVAPPEHYMGEVQRIMYVHVPTAWVAMLTLLWAFICALCFLFGRSWKWDSRMEASIEVGVLLSALLCIQGSIWAKPTWGVWWDWDPRLTTTAVMLFAFIGILALRHFVDDPVRRATWSAVATIVAFADVPIVYFSVKWWNSLHQVQSSPETVDGPMITPLRINAFAMLFLMIALVQLRTRLAQRRLRNELAPPLPTRQDGGPMVAAGGEA